MIVVVDYGMSNLRSIIYKLQKFRFKAKSSSESDDILDADKLILPGVGSFSAGMKNLREYRLVEPLNKKVLEEKTPILGICLGMQLFTSHGEEGDTDGLSWIPGETKRFSFKDGVSLRLPHVGWNTVELKRNTPLFSILPDEMRFYFTHSYHLVCEDEEDVVATTNYGYDFPSVVQRENIVGVQFHPEKSHVRGMELIKNFVEYF